MSIPKLFAILCWYDESPTWLSATVASLSKIGVTHLIAVDGRYPHFNPLSRRHLSHVEQMEAIAYTAQSVGIQTTIHQPDRPLTEVDKRNLAFDLAILLGEPMRDWVFIIDADETILMGEDVRRELAEVTSHAAKSVAVSKVDPHAEPDADNGLREKSEEIYRAMPQARTETTFTQSRFFRIMPELYCPKNHWAYHGVDDAGKLWFLRGDTGTDQWALPGAETSVIAKLDTRVEILHRKNQRTAERKVAKKNYYTSRDSLGLEA